MTTLQTWDAGEESRSQGLARYLKVSWQTLSVSTIPVPNILAWKSVECPKYGMMDGERRGAVFNKWNVPEYQITHSQGRWWKRGDVAVAANTRESWRLTHELSNTLLGPFARAGQMISNYQSKSTNAEDLNIFFFLFVRNQAEEMRRRKNDNWRKCVRMRVLSGCETQTETWEKNGKFRAEKFHVNNDKVQQTYGYYTPKNCCLFFSPANVKAYDGTHGACFELCWLKSQVNARRNGEL